MLFLLYAYISLLLFNIQVISLLALTNGYIVGFDHFRGLFRVGSFRKQCFQKLCTLNLPRGPSKSFRLASIGPRCRLLLGNFRKFPRPFHLSDFQRGSKALQK